MAEKIITTVFDVESEAYQAFSEVKNKAINERYVVSQMVLVKNENGRYQAKDWFDTGVESRNDAHIGGLMGGLLGIIGGPIGMLLGGSFGYLAGSVKDAGDVVGNASIIEKVQSQIINGETALIALIQETDANSFEADLSKWSSNTISEDAAEVAEEVAEAEKLQREMEKEARKKMREEKKAAGKEKIEEQRAKLRSQFDQFINKNK